MLLSTLAKFKMKHSNKTVNSLNRVIMIEPHSGWLRARTLSEGVSAETMVTPLYLPLIESNYAKQS